MKCTRVKQAAFQEQIQELGAQETEFVQKKQPVTTETETEVKEHKTTEKTTAVTAQTDRAKASEETSERETESETGSENGKNSIAVQKQHILLFSLYF